MARKRDDAEMTGPRPRLRASSRAFLLFVPAGAFAALWLTGITPWTVAAAVAVAFFAFGVWRLGIERTAVSERAHLVRLIDAIPLATVVFAADATTVTWNRAAEALFGWSADEVVGLDNPIVRERDEQGSDELARRILSGEALRGVEVERYARDGTPLQLAIYSAPVHSDAERDDGFLVLYDNIAERKSAELERDEAQRRYQDLVEALPLVTYIDDTDELATNVYTSPQIETLLGWSPEEFATNPRGFADLLHADDRERVMALVAHHNREHTLFEAEYRMRHRDGHYVWVRDHSLVVEDAHGHAFARGFLLDITERKNLEEQLQQAQKLDALGQFAGGVAHDFNNLLTAIGGYADLAGAAIEPGSTGAHSLGGIKTAAAEAASLTSQLLSFSRRHVVERRLVDLNEIVRESVTLLERTAGPEVGVSLDLAEPLPLLSGDPAQLKQVVLNLALNACDAMPDGGTLTLETVTAGDSVVLRVRDTGTGMDAETRLRAMEPFFTTKAEGAVTGLGLSVVHGVVSSLGGSVTIDSTPGGGATVEVTLPAANQEHGVVVEPQLAGDHARVLVVEDREVVRHLARDVLEAAGFDVTTAASGPEALAVSDESFDLLLSDVVMPEMSGPALAVRLRELHPTLRVLFMSGYTDDVLDAVELQRSDTAFLRKPFGNDDLVGAVQELLDSPG